MPKYTPQKVQKTITTVNKLIENQVKQTAKIHELKTSLERIQYAMIKDFKAWMKSRIDELAILQLKKIDEDDIHNYKYQNHKSIAKMRAKRDFRRELESVYHGLGQIHPGDYSKFEVLALRTQERDRKNLIKEGSIKDA